jgi:hypothetical protein
MINCALFCFKIQQIADIPYNELYIHVAVHRNRILFK